MNKTFVTRSYETYTATFDVATWDLECETVWEKILYIEYCSWAGHNTDGIELSIMTIAKKVAKTQSDYSLSAINKHLKSARKSLIEKGVIKVLTKKGYRGIKLVKLFDTWNSFQKKRFKNKHTKQRKYLYGMGVKTLAHIDDETELAPMGATELALWGANLIS